MVAEEQRSQAAHQACNRVRSGLTQWVRVIDGRHRSKHPEFEAIASGQLRFLG